MTLYELVYILHPDLEANLEVVTERVKQLVQTAGGEVANEDIWGKRRLAYPIRKQSFGVYVVLDLRLPSEKVREFGRELGLVEEVIRYLLVTKPAPRRTAPPKRTRAPRREREAVSEQPESERLKALDEKLEEIIGPSEETEKPEASMISERRVNTPRIGPSEASQEPEALGGAERRPNTKKDIGPSEEDREGKTPERKTKTKAKSIESNEEIKA